MWKIVQEVLPALLVILFITQWVIPIVFNLKTWWLFRRGKKTEITEKPAVPSSTLLEEIESTKTVVNEAKAKANVVIEKVEENLKSAEDLKKAADKLK